MACIDVHAIACILAFMQKDLLKEIESCMSNAGIGPHRFGLLSVGNGRLVERLRAGGRVWPETEKKIKAFIKERAPAEKLSA